jgi:hypothetical protein
VVVAVVLRVEALALLVLVAVLRVLLLQQLRLLLQRIRAVGVVEAVERYLALKVSVVLAAQVLLLFVGQSR